MIKKLLIGVSLLTTVMVHATTYYVSTSGNDSPNTGTSLSDPFRTVQKALDTVSAGDVILLRGGTYREEAKVKANSGHVGSAGNLITVSNYNGETVVLKGSDVVSGWTVQDAGNHIWKHTGWTAESQQVFVHASPSFSDTDEGYPLQQVGSIPSYSWADSSHTNFFFPTNTYMPPGLDVPGETYAIYYSYYASSPGATNGIWIYVHPSAALTYMATHPGTFYYDNASDTLYVRLTDNGDPNNYGVEASTRMQVLTSDNASMGNYFKVRGLRFRHSNTAAVSSIQPMVNIGGESQVLDCDISWGDFCGLYVQNNTTISNCIINYNGNSGINSPGGYLHITDCTLNGNNYRNLFSHAHCGGMKLITEPTSVTDAFGIVENCEVGWNNGPGIWFDGCHTTNTKTIRNNYVHNNAGNGIFFEISNQGRIYNNMLISNLVSAVYLSASDNTQVLNNTIRSTTGTTTNDLVAEIEVGGLPRAWNANYIPSLVSNIIMNNLVYSTNANVKFGFWLWYTNNQFVLNANGETNLIYGNVIDYNGYYMPNHSYGEFCFPGCGYPATGPGTTLTNWQAVTGFDRNGLVIKPLFDPGSVNGWGLSYMSPLIDRGTNLTLVTDDYWGNARPIQRTHDIGAIENYGFVRGDMDTNGKPDILWRSYGSATGPNSVWLMNGTNLLFDQYVPSLNTNYRSGAIHDYDGDGFNDIVWHHRTSTNVNLWSMSGTNYLGLTRLKSMSPPWEIVAGGDFDEDGYPDLLLHDPTTGDSLVRLMQGTNWIRSVNLPGQSDTTWDMVGVDDFNRDGYNDILWRKTDGQNKIWYMEKTNHVKTLQFTASAISHSGYRIGAVQDYNGDGWPDIMARRASDGKDLLLLMQGTNTIKVEVMATDTDSNRVIIGP